MIKYFLAMMLTMAVVFSSGCGKKDLAVLIHCDIEKAEIIVNGQPTAVVQNEKAELKLLPGAYDLSVKTISYGEKNIKVEVKTESKNEFNVFFLGTVILQGLVKGDEVSMNNQKVAIIDDAMPMFVVKLEPGTYEFSIKTAKGTKKVTTEVKAGETIEKSI